MVKGVFDHLAHEGHGNLNGRHRRNVNGTPISFDPGFRTEPDDEVRAVFHRLGSDGAVGANQEQHQDHR